MDVWPTIFSEKLYLWRLERARNNDLVLLITRLVLCLHRQHSLFVPNTQLWMKYTEPTIGQNSLSCPYICTQLTLLCSKLFIDCSAIRTYFKISKFRTLGHWINMEGRIMHDQAPISCTYFAGFCPKMYIFSAPFLWPPGEVTYVNFLLVGCVCLHPSLSPNGRAIDGWPVASITSTMMRLF